MTLHVALVEPQIPPNTGNIARLCAATGSALHLVEPLGFSLADPDLKRAGLDYWDAVDLWVHPDWAAFVATVRPERCLYFSTRGARLFWEAPYRDGSVLVFGREDLGLPADLLERHAGSVYRIPTLEAVRSLNLATAAGIVVYEALRRLAGPLPSLPART
jgi:tRNA (cytidine/uridine-2'-O-)-methyltransferase